jgi:myosin-1
MQTDKAVYFVISAAKDGRVTTSLERKIPLVTIRAISMTNLRDDFVVSSYNTRGVPAYL